MKAVELGQINLAEDDPDVLLTACHLARVFQRLDDYSAARRVLEESYAAGQWRLGDHDPLMVEISHDIGVVAEELGNRHEARKAFTRVAEYGPAALGTNHEAVVRAQAYLGHAPDSVRLSPPTIATGAARQDAEPHLTLVTPVPSVSPFPEPVPVDPDPAVPVPAVGDLGVPAPRRSPEGLDEPTVVQPTITPRAPGTGSAVQPVPDRLVAWPAPPLPAEAATAPHLPAQRAPGGRQWPPPAGRPGPHVGQPGLPRDQSGFVPPGTHFPPSGPGVPPGGAPFAGGFASGAEAAYRKRGVTLFAAVAAALASVIAVAALVFVLANRDDDNRHATASDVPTLAGAAPTGVRLHDRGAEIEIDWMDPTSGTVSFMIVMAHPGEELKPIATLGPGKTSYAASGLSTRLNYCLAVVAVYRANQFATSPQSCTSRTSAGPGSSTGK